MKIKTIVSTLATVAAVATAETAKGQETKVTDIFKAPIDQILSITDDKVITYRPEAMLVTEKAGRAETNYYPTVAVSADGSKGFAFQGPAPTGSLLVNEEGMFVSGSKGQSSEISIGQIREGTDLLEAVKMKKFNLVGNQDTNALHEVKDVSGYVYGDKIILFSQNGLKRPVTHRAIQISDDKFKITSHSTEKTKGSPYRPKMAAKTSQKVYLSDGTDVSSFGMDMTSAAVSKVTENTTIKGLESVNDTMYYATESAVCNENGTVLNVDGISGLAKIDSTLYVGTTNDTTSALSPVEVATKGAAKSAFTAVVVGNAKQIVSAKENGKAVLYKLTMDNVLQRVD